jgi:predicted nucleic acid-binding protein
MSRPVAVVDTSIFIGAKNPDEVEHSDCLRVLELCHAHRIVGLVSAITVAEVLTGYRVEGDEVGGRQFVDYVGSSGRMVFVPMGMSVCETAADVCGTTSLRIPDAIIVATAIDRSATALLTHDREFGRTRDLVDPLSAKAMLKRIHRAE